MTMTQHTAASTLQVLACLTLLSACVDTPTELSPDQDAGAGASTPTPDGGDGEGSSGPSYADDIFPILNSHCIGCHGGASAMGRVDLSTHERALRQVSPGAPEASSLYTAIVEERMPPAGVQPVSEDSLEQIRLWILDGAAP